MNSIRHRLRISVATVLLLPAAVLFSGLAAAQSEADPEAEASRVPVSGLPIDAGTLLTAHGAGWIALPAVATEVELTVTGMLVHGKLRQQFDNPGDRTIDTVYVFPLPEKAAVHAMELRIGDRVIRSVVQEKAEARKTYDAARAAGMKAALVEQQRPNLFSVEAANVRPGESVEVTLEYIEEIVLIDGEFRLRFPLRFTPRFTPPGSPPPPQNFLAAEPRASIDVRLRPGFVADAIESDSHPIDVSPLRDGYRVRPTRGRVDADRDFHLRWRPSAHDRTQLVTFVETRNGERYAMVMMVPPQPRSAAGWGLPTETMFVVDVSSSMAGPSMAQARTALERALTRLRPEDRFNLIAFNDGYRFFRPASQQADGAALDEATAWVRGLRATGGTMIQPALMAGIQALETAASSHQPRMIFLTDGAVSNERQVLRTVVDALGDTRLHTLAIGAAPNNYLMRKMAEHGRGHHEFVFDLHSVERRLDDFFERIDRPVLTDLQVRWSGADPLEIFPSPLPDLYPGQPVFLTAKLRSREGDALDGEIELTGFSREGSFEARTALGDGAGAAPGIAVHWARARVEYLMDGLIEGVDPKSVREAVLDIALDFGLVTRYSSRVAVEDFPTAVGEPPQPRRGAVLPQGGTWNPLKRLALLLSFGAGLLLLVLRRAIRH